MSDITSEYRIMNKKDPNNGSILATVVEVLKKNGEPFSYLDKGFDERLIKDVKDFTLFKPSDVEFREFE